MKLTTDNNYNKNILRDRAEEARKAHNLEVTGSNPVPATTKMLFVCVPWFNQELKGSSSEDFLFYLLDT